MHQANGRTGLAKIGLLRRRPGGQGPPEPASQNDAQRNSPVFREVLALFGNRRGAPGWRKTGGPEQTYRALKKKF
jgi:hypothetical protein